MTRSRLPVCEALVDGPVVPVDLPVVKIGVARPGVALGGGTWDLVVVVVALVVVVVALVVVLVEVVVVKLVVEAPLVVLLVVDGTGVDLLYVAVKVY